MHVIGRTRLRSLTGWRAAAASLTGAGLTAVCAQIGFHLPGNPIPVTLQVFAVICCGMALGGRLGAISQIEYLLAGAAGAPVFAGFKGGIGGPTAGYLVGFVVAAYVTGALAERLRVRSFSGLCVAGLAGAAVIYVFGRAWFALWLGDLSGLRSWAFGVAPFVGVDALKVVAAAAICGRRAR